MKAMKTIRKTTVGALLLAGACLLGGCAFLRGGEVIEEGEPPAPISVQLGEGKSQHEAVLLVKRVVSRRGLIVLEDTEDGFLFEYAVRRGTGYKARATCSESTVTFSFETGTGDESRTRRLFMRHARNLQRDVQRLAFEPPAAVSSASETVEE